MPRQREVDEQAPVEGVPSTAPGAVALVAGCAACGGVFFARLRWGAPPARGWVARAKGRGQTRHTPHTPHRTIPPRSLGTLTLTSEGVAEKAALLTASLSRQFLQQRLSLLQVSGVKALGKPAVDRRQQVMGFRALALLLP
jgi:hypothetical protein